MTALTEPQVRDLVASALSPLGLAGKKVLLVVPDSTRTAPVGLLSRAALLVSSLCYDRLRHWGGKRWRAALQLQAGTFRSKDSRNRSLSRAPFADRLVAREE